MADPRVATMIQQGQQALQSGNPGRAREYFKTAVALDPENVTAWLWLAGVQDDPAEAQQSLERVLELDPDNLRAQQGLAQLRAQYGDAGGMAEPAPLATRSSGVDLEQELRAQLRDDSGGGAAIVDEPTERASPFAFFQSDSDDMMYRVAVAALALFLVIGMCCFVLILTGIIPARA